MPVDQQRVRVTLSRMVRENKLPSDLTANATTPTASHIQLLTQNFDHVNLRDQQSLWAALLQVERERREADRAIQEKRDAFTGFGSPTTDLDVGSDGRGYKRHFQNGSIFWLPSWGAHEVHGAIRDKYASLGWESSFLRYPTTDERAAGTSRYNDFEGGVIEWSPTSGASVAMVLFVRIERHQLGAWVHMSGQGFTPGGTVRFSVHGLAGFVGDRSTGVFANARADGTFADVVWDGRTWPRGGTAEMIALDQASGRTAAATIPALD